MARSTAIVALLVPALFTACGSDSSQPGPFEAQRLATLADGSVLVAGVHGRCGDLALRRVGSGADGEPVSADRLGGECVNSVERVTVTRRGVDVVAEVKRNEGGPFESDVLTPKGVARFRPDGTLDEDFGDDGAVKGVSESTVSFPDGSVADPDTRFSPSGEVVSNPSLPLDLIPGEEVLAPSGAGRLVVAGTPRGVTGIRPTVFARLTADGGLDRSFGRGGEVTVPVGSPVDLEVLPGGQTLAAFLGGVVVKLDPTGRPDRSFGREGTATLFARTPPGSIVRIAVGRRDELAAMRVTGGRADVLRLGGDGRPLPGFSSRPLRAAGGGDLAFDRSGRLLVLAGTRRIVALDERGRQVSPLDGGALSVGAR